MATTVTMSGTQFDALPYEEGRRWELLEGELIERPSPTPRHQDIVFLVLSTLRVYLSTGAVEGLAFGDVEFALSDRDRLRPDVCVLIGEKARGLDRDRVPIPGAPDIAIEVISPNERAMESQAKVQTYLRHGAAEVWQIYPKSRTLQIHRGENSVSIDADQQVRSGVLPGLGARVSAFFE
jgi:Uma2 family endonuclease